MFALGRRKVATVESQATVLYCEKNKVFRLVDVNFKRDSELSFAIKSIKDNINQKLHELKSSGDNLIYYIFDDVIKISLQYILKMKKISFPVVVARGISPKNHCIDIGFDNNHFVIKKIHSHRRLTPENFLNSLRNEIQIHYNQMDKLLDVIDDFTILEDELLQSIKQARFKPGNLRNVPAAKCEIDLEAYKKNTPASIKELNDIESKQVYFKEEEIVIIEKKEKPQKRKKTYEDLINGYYELNFQQKNLELYLSINSTKFLKMFTEKKYILALINVIKGRAKELISSGMGGKYRIFSKDIVDSIQKTLEKKEEKLTILVLKGEKSEPGRIELSLSANKMHLYLASLKQSKGGAKQILIKDIMTEIEKLGIRKNLKKAKKNAIRALKLINEKKDLPPDFVLSMGKGAIDGKDGEIDLVFQKRKVKFGKGKYGSVDLRERTNTTFVRKGKVILKIVDPGKGKDGWNLLGELIPAKDGEKIELEAGDGVSVSADGKTFFAKRDGVPEIADTHVELMSVYVVEGGVNFKTGNVRYDGNLVVNGDVDSGATAEATGDLKITGSIQSGSAVAGGKIEVEKGILTGKEGRVEARGNIDAGYIENSKVISYGHIKVSESIVNSEVSATGSIKCIDGEGIIRGGSINCQSLECNNLGVNDGPITIINAGVDFSYELQKQKLSEGIKNFEKDLDQIRREIKTIRSHKAIKIGSQNAKDKLKTLVRERDFIQGELKDYTEQMSVMVSNKPIPPAGFVRVSVILSYNVKLVVNGKRAVMSKELMGIVWLYKRLTNTVEMISCDEFQVEEVEDDEDEVVDEGTDEVVDESADEVNDEDENEENDLAENAQESAA